LVLNVYREKTDELPMIPLLNEFIGRCETRLHRSINLIWGKFWGGFSPPVLTGLILGYPMLP